MPKPILGLILGTSLGLLDGLSAYFYPDARPMLMTIVAVWAADVAAYAVGSTVGRRKIVPRISPGKTWEGTIAGLLSAGAVVILWSRPGLGVPASSVLLAILNVIDHEMNVQQAIDAPRFHHQWLPDRIAYEKFGLAPDTLLALKARGHTLFELASQGVAQAILLNAKEDLLEGGFDRRAPDSGAAGR